MQVPIQVVFHGLAHSPALHDLIRQLAGQACRASRKVQRCHVAVEQPHRHQSQGRGFRIRVCLHVAGGGEVVAEQAGEDAQQAAREAFAAVRRQLDAALERAQQDARGRDGRPLIAGR